MRSEHLDETTQHVSSNKLQDQKPTGGEDDDNQMVLSEEKLSEIQNLPILEKQHMILNFLRAHRGSGCLAPNVIYKSIGIDLVNDMKLAEMLQQNPKIKIDMVPDPENPALLIATYAYQAKYSMVRDRTSLLAQINRMVSGVPKKDLEDSYPTVENDLQALITAGDVVAVANTEDKDKILFPRGEAFLVELDGIISVPIQRMKKTDVNENDTGSDAQKDTPDAKKSTGAVNYSEHEKKIEGNDNGGDADINMASNHSFQDVFVISTDVDPCCQIRRGEAIQVGGEWFRVSSAVKAGVSLAEQPARAQAPLSVVSLADLPKRNEVDGYIRPLDQKSLPLDNSLSSAGIHAIQKAKKARERLIEVAHGIGATRSSGGGGGSLGVLVSQALGSLAHAGNPTALVGAAASLSMGQMSSSSSIRRNRANTSAASAASVGRSAATTKEELIAAASDVSLAMFKHARRHGCTKDIRQMYLETAKLVPESDLDLQAKLVEHKLLEPGEKLRRDRIKRPGTGTNVDNDGKPKKRRYYERKNQRMTNTHLDGTTEGAILALALEQQKQGKSVGDGGM